MTADEKWSPSEKKVARTAYDAALKVALDKTLAELKSRAHVAATPSEMWDVEDFCCSSDGRWTRCSTIAIHS
ncbi:MULTISPECIES: hypothetical protein [unclassified Mesorhizobium]|uniref:hypothetical protein n=1 Tax=unclassified Mesorhizobium TaxID=325217 RepID=UPI00333DA7E8